MIRYKTEEDIIAIKKSCLLVSRTHGEVAKIIRPGVKTQILDRVAEEFIRDNGGVPGFKGYHGFPSTLCVSVNSVVVHGIPSEYELRDGDIVSVDCGVILDSYWGDSAYTYPVGDVDEKVLNLLEVTKKSLYLGIENAIEGKRLGDISHAIQSHAEANGYSVVREMVGHGVGFELHEKPEVPNYGRRGHGIKLKKGLVIAIEPMINLGKKEIVQEEDGWTIRTSDNQVSAHFEHTIAINKGEAELLTTFSFIEEVFKY